MQLWFISQYPYLRHLSEARNATQPNLNSDIIKALRITLPPLREQEQIVEDTSAEAEAVKVAIEHARHEINLLHEYRTRLIADVVTGKLDVRQVAAGLPEEAMDDELIEDEGLEDLEAGEEDLDLIGDADG
jgi:type I restriction enzyme S subunit